MMWVSYDFENGERHAVRVKSAHDARALVWKINKSIDAKNAEITYDKPQADKHVDIFGVENV